VAGRVKAGKSTLLNALVGEELAPTDAGECTRVVTWYQDGLTYRVTIDPKEGPSTPARFTRHAGVLEIDLEGRDPDTLRRLVVAKLEPTPENYTRAYQQEMGAAAPPPAPTVTSVSPNTGPTTGGTVVTITGTGLTGATAVRFGTANAASFSVSSATSITATAPAGAQGAVDVTVTTPGGTSAATGADTFTYATGSSGPPTVTGTAPISGPSAGGTSGTASTVSYRTAWDYTLDTPGTYTMDVVFTATAP